jgi:hypothetical protein
MRRLHLWLPAAGWQGSDCRFNSTTLMYCSCTAPVSVTPGGVALYAVPCVLILSTVQKIASAPPDPTPFGGGNCTEEEELILTDTESAPVLCVLQLSPRHNPLVFSLSLSNMRAYPKICMQKIGSAAPHSAHSDCNCTPRRGANFYALCFKLMLLSLIHTTVLCCLVRPHYIAARHMWRQ